MTKQSQGFVVDHHNDFYVGSLIEINEVTTNKRRNNEGESLVLKAANMSNDVVFHDNSRNTASKEVLLDNGRNNDDDDCAGSQDADRNNEPMPFKTSKREENK